MLINGRLNIPNFRELMKPKTSVGRSGTFTSDTPISGVTSYMKKSGISMDEIMGVSSPDTTTSPNLGVRLGGLSKLTPYASNLINAGRRLPKPLPPTLQSYLPKREVSLDADRARINNQLRSATANIDYGTSNSAVAAAAKAAALGQAVQGTNQLAQQEQGLNAQIGLRTDQINAGIEGANAERLNQYNDNVVGRSIKQQDLNAQNIADLFEKHQLIKRDEALNELESDKLDILGRVYKDSNIIPRNLEDLITTGKGRLTNKWGGKIRTRKYAKSIR